jgi:transposase InsO family protein
MDDILVYSTTKEQHERDVQQVLSLLVAEKLYLKASKCEFFQKDVEFCGNKITSEGIQPTASKVLAMQSRPNIRNPHDIQVYLGTMVWFKDFLPDFSSLTEPLTRLLIKDSRWTWGKEQEESISILIHLVTKSPVLKFFDATRETFVYSDASDFAVGGWIGQKHGDLIHPICYWSRKMTSAERGYAIYDKELLALVSMVNKHSHLLRGVPFTCNTDHRALESLQTQVKLKGRQVRWILALQEYDFQILYQPASKMRVADWLTRNPTMHTLCTKCSSPVELKALTSPDATSFITQVKEAYKADVYVQKLIAWQQNPKLLDSNSLSLLQRFSQAQDLWYYNDSKVVRDHPVFRVRLYIPDSRVLRTALLQRYHESLASGHQAAERTTRQMEKLYYWPGMRTEIQSYTSSCETCQRQQESNHSKYGLLHPLPIPEDRGVDLSIDWFFPGKSIDGFDTVMVIICRLTKLLVLVPCHKTDTASVSAQHFIKHWFSRGYGLPKTITTDRDSKFTSEFWGAFSKQLGVQTNFATPRHQQTNGQAEIQVRIVKKVLRKYADYDATNWSRLLHLVEFSLNNAVNTSTGYSPFYLFFGFEPRVFPEEYLVRKSKATANLTETIGSVLLSAQKHIATSQAEMVVRYNRNRKEAPRFSTGSSVWVKAEGISWPAGVQRPKPLADSMLGPFRVTKGNEAEWPKVGLNVDLDLPPSLSKVHPTFHVEKLEPFIISSKDQFPDRVQYAPAPVARAGHWVAEVESILDHRYHHNQLQYLIKFVGYPLSEAEWHSYEADDPSWEDDIGLVVAYQSTHGLPPRPSGRRRQGLVSNSVPPPLPTPLPSTPLVPVVQPSPPQRRTTRQTRDAVLTAGLCY